MKEYYGENHQLTGQMALRLGAVYHNRQEYEKSRTWYLWGLQILENCQTVLISCTGFTLFPHTIKQHGFSGTAEIWNMAQKPSKKL